MSVLISCEVGGQAGFDQPGSNCTHRAASTGEAYDQEAGGDRPTPAPDLAALYVARRMADYLAAPLVTNDSLPALIDVSRSLHHHHLFSSWTRGWSAIDRQRLIDSIYHPYRERLRTELRRGLSRSSSVVHLSIRTFPSRQNRTIRRADMGLLYDPASTGEVDLALDWIDEMYDELPMLRVRRNYPLRGTRDGITKAMRGEFAGQRYIGMELAINRAWVGRSTAIRDEVIDGIGWTLETVLEIPQSQAA